MSAVAGRPYRLIAQASLQARNTFGVAATAPLLLELHDSEVLSDWFASGRLGADVLMLGSGSNLLFAGDPAATVVALTRQRIDFVDDDGDQVLVRADAGVGWHAFVLHTLAQGLCGLENLALIPGTVGAAPIQNIGAYGVEVRERIHAVNVFDREAREVRRLERGACAFGYRDSLFKRAPDRHVVVSVEFALPRRADLRLDYAGLGDELAAMGITAPSANQVADAVVRIRRRKLPDPAVIGNAGSFFKNPVVPRIVAEALQAQHPALPVFRSDGDATRKLSAAWLIDSCGWKGHRDGDAGVAEHHALVLVNHGAATGAELLALARRIAASVQARFGIALEPEPRIIGATW